MIRELTTNTFNDGMVMDFNPLVTPNTMLTNALNATLLTLNGNENVLLNDMGNGRVETAFLPEGFIPLGTCSFGGIIYIVSYNPLTNQSLIGSFPSPERNILTTELDIPSVNLKEVNFKEEGTGNIITPRVKLQFEKELNPGDKFQIFCPLLEKEGENISAFGEVTHNINKLPKYLKLHIASINKYGEIEYLDNNLVWYESDPKNYYIRTSNINDSDNEDLDEYRNLVSANYSVFNAENKGKLAIIAELECINSFNISFSAKTEEGEEDGTNKAIFTFYVNWTYENPDTVSRNLINLYAVKFDNFKESEYNPENIEELKKGSKLLLFSLNIKDSLAWFNYGDVKELSDKLYIINYYDNVGELFSINDLPTYYSTGNIFKLTNTTVGGRDKLSEDRLNYLKYSYLFRKNDGTDNDYPMKDVFEVTYPVDLLGDSIIKFDAIPGMSYGWLEYLKIPITIDLSKLGKGITDLIQWKYYVNSQNVVINWGFDAYPYEELEIKSIQFDFYELDSSIDFESSFGDKGIDLFIEDEKSYPNQKLEEDGFQDPCESLTPVCTIIEDNKPSYCGYFTNIVTYKEEGDSESTNKLSKNKCYLVRIKIDLGEINRKDDKEIKYRYYYRILYTLPIFNNAYFNTEDFSTLDLYSYYEPILLEYEDKSEILKVNTDYYYGEEDKFNVEGIYSVERIEYEDLRQEDTFTWNIDKTYQLVNDDILGFDYDDTFKEYKFEDINAEPKQYDESVRANNLTIFASEGTVNLDEISLSSDKSPTLEIVSEDNKINIKSPKVESNVIKTPFYCEYLEEPTYITVDYISEKISAYTKDAQVDSGKIINLLCDGLLLCSSHDGTESIDTTGSKIRDWIKQVQEDYDAIELDWSYTSHGKDSPDQGYIITSKSLFLRPYTSDSSVNPIDNEEKALKNATVQKPSIGKVILKTIILKLKSGGQYMLITQYYNNKTDISNNGFLEFINSLNKWVSSLNKLVRAYKLINPVVYNDYTAILDINLEDVDLEIFKLNSYKIDDLEIQWKEEDEESNIPKNLRLKLPNFSIPSIEGSLKIKTSSLKSKLNDNTSLLYYDGSSNKLYFNQDRSTPFIIEDDEILKIRSVVWKNNVELVFKTINNNLIIDQLRLVSDDYYTNVYFWSEIKGNTKKWYKGGGSTENGQLIIMYNMILLAGDVKSSSDSSGSILTDSDNFHKGPNEDILFEVISTNSYI